MERGVWVGEVMSVVDDGFFRLDFSRSCLKVSGSQGESQ